MKINQNGFGTMSLIFRLTYVFIISLFREKLPVGKSQSLLKLMTLTNDLDLNMHMNNGRFLTICDLNRMDMFFRTGLAKVMFQKRWVPIVAEHTMVYQRPLKLFEKFTVTASLTHWDDKYFYMTHEFSKNNRQVAIGTSKGLVRSKKGTISPEAVIEAVNSSRQLKTA